VDFLIDSSVIIALERGKLALDDLAARLEPKTVAIAAITASELLHGVHRAETSSRRKRRTEFVDAILARLPVLPFDLEVARTHAAIWSDLARDGVTIGAHDLQIAATAIAHEMAVATHNAREFLRVEGLNVVTW
jgi:tRNA(fMet)-specific endonuclease VapC